MPPGDRLRRDNYTLSKRLWVPNRGHAWVKEVYLRMPEFLPTVMFRLCTNKYYNHNDCWLSTPMGVGIQVYQVGTEGIFILHLGSQSPCSGGAASRASSEEHTDRSSFAIHVFLSWLTCCLVLVWRPGARGVNRWKSLFSQVSTYLPNPYSPMKKSRGRYPGRIIYTHGKPFKVITESQQDSNHVQPSWRNAYAQ